MSTEKLADILKDKYPVVYTWFCNLAKEPISEITCHNLIRDVEFKTSKPMILANFLEKTNEILKRLGPGVPLPKTIFRQVREEIAQEVCLKGQLIIGDSSGNCCFTLKKGYEVFGLLCRIMKLERFRDYSENRSSRYLENPLEGVDYDNTIELNIDSLAGFLFVARKPEVEDFLGHNPSEKDWKRLLAAFGLINEVSNKTMRNHYVLIYYPEDFSPFRMCQPTFIEGGGKPEFCIHDSRDGWGRTLDLGSLTSRQVEILEAVHSPYGKTKVKYEIFNVPPSPLPDYSKLVEILRT